MKISYKYARVISLARDEQTISEMISLFENTTILYTEFNEIYEMLKKAMEKIEKEIKVLIKE